jgi:large subunit ribosomal protein L9
MDAEMEIILLEKVDNLGGIGDKVKVKSGYGRNYLIPKGKATLATPEHLAEFEERRAELEAKAAGELKLAEERAVKIAELNLVIENKVGSEGKLFGSVGTLDIAEAAAAAGVPIERDEIRLPDGPIRLEGEHTIQIHIHTDIDVPLTLKVVAEEQ